MAPSETFLKGPFLQPGELSKPVVFREGSNTPSFTDGEYTHAYYIILCAVCVVVLNNERPFSREIQLRLGPILSRAGWS